MKTNHQSLFIITAFIVASAFFVSSAAAQSGRRGIGAEVEKNTDPANGARRVALVIGNTAYQTAPLKNPVNDARAVAQALSELGFEVTSRENLSQNDMKRAIRAFGEKARNSSVRLVYYAGHGMQVNGENYLIPVDASFRNEQEVEYEAVNAGFVLAQMEDTGNSLNIVILDACRNNPFARNFRSMTRGLAAINAPSGTLIAYATAPGSVASDGEGSNGLYTQELLRHLRTPGINVEEVFKRVRIGVRDKTHGKQTPWEASSLTGDFYFSGGDKPSPSASGSDAGNYPRPASPKPAPVSPLKVDAQFFTFDLRQCKISGDSVICDFDVTNNENDRDLAVAWFACVLADDKGNTVEGTTARLANKTVAYNSAPSALMVKDVVVRGRVKFDGVSPDATRIALLKLAFITRPSEVNPDLVVSFRNVPLER